MQGMWSRNHGSHFIPTLELVLDPRDESACPRSNAATMVCPFNDGVSQYLCSPLAPFQDAQFVSGTVERLFTDKLVANWAPSIPSLGATREKRFRPWLYS